MTGAWQFINSRSVMLMWNSKAGPSQLPLEMACDKISNGMTFSLFTFARPSQRLWSCKGNGVTTLFYMATNQSGLGKTVNKIFQKWTTRKHKEVSLTTCHHFSLQVYKRNSTPSSSRDSRKRAMLQAIVQSDVQMAWPVGVISSSHIAAWWWELLKKHCARDFATNLPKKNERRCRRIFRLGLWRATTCLRPSALFPKYVWDEVCCLGPKPEDAAWRSHGKRET